MKNYTGSSFAVAEETLLDTREAAEILRCKPSLLAKWRRQHCGPTYLRVGRLVRYSRPDLTDFLRSCKVSREK